MSRSTTLRFAISTLAAIAMYANVLFVNHDGKPHQISSDPVQIHTDCPGINEVGVLGPGGSGQTGTLTVVRTCG
jgi:hypothetical protein